MSYGERIREIAQSEPNRAAIIYLDDEDAETRLDYRALDRAADRVAERLESLGAASESTVAIALPNGIDFYVAMIATWRIGACPVFLKPDFTAPERARYGALAQPAVLVGDWNELPDVPQIDPAALKALIVEDHDPLPRSDVLPQRAWAIASGGSTGKPKLIVNCRPAQMGHAWFAAISPEGPDEAVQLVCTPLYHTSALSLSVNSLVAGETLLVIDRFNAARVVSLIRRYRVTFIGLVAATLIRIVRLPDVVPADLASLRWVVAGGGAISNEIIRLCDNLFGAEKLTVGYGASEGIGSASIRGDELLSRPGTVGKPTTSDVEIVGEDGNLVQQGEVGELYMRLHNGDSDKFEYWGGDDRRVRPGGFVSVGDLAYLDADGYLYIVDRRTDMIKTGGVNVFPAEVESALLEHAGITDAVVLGIPDPDWGRRLHAVVVPTDPAHSLDANALVTFLKERLVPQKIPKAFEFVESLGRADTMKLNRAAMADARTGLRQK